MLQELFRTVSVVRLAEVFLCCCSALWALEVRTPIFVSLDCIVVSWMQWLRHVLLVFAVRHWSSQTRSWWLVRTISTVWLRRTSAENLTQVTCHIRSKQIHLKVARPTNFVLITVLFYHFSEYGNLQNVQITAAVLLFAAQHYHIASVYLSATSQSYIRMAKLIIV